MITKVKTFICNKLNDEGLTALEKEVNDFTRNHRDVIDIKVSTVCNNFGAVLIYTVLYEGE